MDIEIYFHGNPAGFICTPDDNGQDFFDHYYKSERKVRKEFRIEMRPYNGKTYFYYTYMRSVDLSDNKGRPNAYCAITMRLDAFYTDVMCIYDFLEMLYRALIENRGVMKQNGPIWQYNVEDFPSAFHNEAMKMLRSFQSVFSSAHCGEMPSPKGVLKTEINPLDCNSTKIVQAFKKSSSVSISPEYPLERETNSTTLQRDLKREINRLTTENAEVKVANESLKQQNGEQKLQIDKLVSSQSSAIAIKQENEALRKTCQDIYTKVDAIRSYGSRNIPDKPLSPITPPAKDKEGSLTFTSLLVSLGNLILLVVLIFIISCSGEKKEPPRGLDENKSNIEQKSSSKTSEYSHLQDKQHEQEQSTTTSTEDTYRDLNSTSESNTKPPLVTGIPPEAQIGESYNLAISPEYIQQHGYNNANFTWKIIRADGKFVTAPGSRFLLRPSTKSCTILIYYNGSDEPIYQHYLPCHS